MSSTVQLLIELNLNYNGVNSLSTSILADRIARKLTYELALLDVIKLSYKFYNDSVLATDLFVNNGYLINFTCSYFNIKFAFHKIGYIWVVYKL